MVTLRGQTFDENLIYAVCAQCGDIVGAKIANICATQSFNVAGCYFAHGEGTQQRVLTTAQRAQHEPGRWNKPCQHPEHGPGRVP